MTRGPIGVVLDPELERELRAMLERLEQFVPEETTLEGVPANMLCMLAFALGMLAGYGVEHERILELAEDLVRGLELTGGEPGIPTAPGDRRDH